MDANESTPPLGNVKKPRVCPSGARFTLNSLGSELPQDEKEALEQSLGRFPRDARFGNFGSRKTLDNSTLPSDTLLHYMYGCMCVKAWGTEDWSDGPAPEAVSRNPGQRPQSSTEKGRVNDRPRGDGATYDAALRAEANRLRPGDRFKQVVRKNVAVRARRQQQIHEVASSSSSKGNKRSVPTDDDDDDDGQQRPSKRLQTTQASTRIRTRSSGKVSPPPIARSGGGGRASGSAAVMVNRRRFDEFEDAEAWVLAQWLSSPTVQKREEEQEAEFCDRIHSWQLGLA